MWNPYQTLPSQLKRTLQAVGVLGTLAAWASLSYLIYPPGSTGMNPLPSPWEVAEGLGVLIQGGQLLPALGGSLARVLAANTLIAVIGIPLGILMGGSPKLDTLFGTVLYPLRSAPIAAVMPLMILWLGSGDTMKIGFLALGSIVYLVPLTADAIKTVPNRYWRTVHDLNGTPWEALVKGVVPVAAPRIFDATITCVSVSWTYITVAEFVTAEAGLGRLMSLAKRQNNAQVIGIILLILALAWITDLTLRAIRNRLYKFEA